MKYISPLLSFLARGNPGQARSDDSDTTLSIPPTFINGGDLPLPLLKLFQSASAEVRNVSHAGFLQLAMNASNTQNLTTLGEGLWEVFWAHYIEISGAVADITAVSDFRINIATISGGFTILSRFRGQQVEQGRQGNFRTMITRGGEMTFDLSNAAGAGTSTSFARATLICNKLL